MALKRQQNPQSPLAEMARLPTMLRYLILAGVFAGILAVYGFTLYKSIRTDLGRLDDKLAELNSDISKSRAVESNLKSFEKKHKELRTQLDTALQKLPNARDLPVLLTDISGLAKKSGLEIRSFRPEAEVSRGFYAEVPIRLEFSGHYHEAGVFFDRLSRLSRIVNISELEMKPGDPESDPPELRMRGIATTFRFLENTVPSKGGA